MVQLLKAFVVGCLAAASSALTFTNIAFKDISPSNSVNVTWEGADGPVTLTLFQDAMAISSFFKNSGVIAFKQAKKIFASEHYDANC